MLHCRLLPLLVCLALASCQAVHDEPAGSGGLFVQGRAVVVTVDAETGHAILNIDGRNVEAYWQTEHNMAQPGTTVRTDVNRPPVGIYREPSVMNNAFEAKPGDTIAFKGMKTGASIFLQAISVISK